MFHHTTTTTISHPSVCLLQRCNFHLRSSAAIRRGQKIQWGLNRWAQAGWHSVMKVDLRDKGRGGKGEPPLCWKALMEKFLLPKF